MTQIMRSLLALVSLFLATFSLGADAQTVQEADWQQGLSAYQRFVVYPHIERGFNALKNNEIDRGITEFTQAHKLAANQPQIALYLAQALESDHQYQAAINLLVSQLAKNANRQDLKQALDFAKNKIITRMLDEAESLISTPQALQKYLSSHHPEFIHPYDEYRWIKLLAEVSNRTNKLLISYKPVFHSNDIFQIELAIKVLYDQKNLSGAKRYIDRIGKELVSNPQVIDHISYQLIEQGSPELAVQLLLTAYPFKGANDTLRKSMLGRLALAQSESTDKKQLLTFVQNKKANLDTASQEQEWLKLLMIAAQDQVKPLLDYQCKFDTNRPIQAKLVLDAFEESEGKIQAKQLAQFLPYLPKLDPTQLDQVSFKLAKEGDTKQSLKLLFDDYPYREATPTVRNMLVDRLSGIATQQPSLLAPHDLAILSIPLENAELRGKQAQLLETLHDCDGVDRVLEDFSKSYTKDDWLNLGVCYQKQEKPGLALFAYRHAYYIQPTTQVARAIAYQAFATKDFQTSFDMWKVVLSSKEFTTADQKAAVYTAVADNQMMQAGIWLSAYRANGGKPDDEYWWLKTTTELKDDPAQALIDIQQAIALAPKVEYFETLAELETKYGNEKAAIESLEKALALNPENSSVEASLGYAYYHQNKMATSEQYLSRALKMRPDDNKLIEQLAFTNQHLGQNERAIYFTERAIDNDDLYSNAEMTPEIVNQRFGLRRMHEDLSRRWTLSVDAISGNQIASVPNAPQPGLNYKSYGQAEIAYRLGDPAIDDGKTISAFSRLFAGNGASNSALPIYAPVLAAGLRWKPFSDQVINLSIEEQIPLDQGQSATTNTLVRISASFFNNGKYSDEWHPTAQGWMAQNLYLDAAYYLVNQLSSLTADYRVSYHNKFGENKTLEPYSHIQWNSLNQQNQPDVRVGMGVRWNVWGNESHYNAYASKISVGVELQYALSTYLSDKTTALLTFGGRW